MIRAKVFGQSLPLNSLEHPAQRHAIHDAAVNTISNQPTRKLIHHHQNLMGFQYCGFAAEQIATPQTIPGVAEKREPGRTCRIRVWALMNAQDAAHNILVDLNAKRQSELPGAIRGQPQVGFRCFISTTASMSSSFGPGGPGRLPPLEANNMRYFASSAACGDAARWKAS